MKEQWVPVLTISKWGHNKWSDQHTRLWRGAKDREPAVGSFWHCFHQHQVPQSTSPTTASRMDLILPCGWRKSHRSKKLSNEGNKNVWLGFWEWESKHDSKVCSLCNQMVLTFLTQEEKTNQGLEKMENKKTVSTNAKYKRSTSR